MIATMASIKIISRKLYCFTCYLALCLILMSCGGGGDGEAAAPASAPTITSFTPISGSVGTSVTITGTNLTGITGVRFNSIAAATFAVVSATSVTATVPSGATTGTIAVTTPGGIATSSSSFTVSSSTQIIANHTRTGTIPADAVNLAKANLHIAYGHTSHGSQLVTGMNALAKADPLYKWSNGVTAGALDLRDGALGGDVGYYPDWVNNTRSYLGTVNGSGRGANHPEINVIIWSWCGQVALQTQQTMIDEYLNPMTQLEAEYTGVKFVYMTGHLDGTGSAGNLNQRNQQIRDYCNAHNKILFDFADIESYNPSGSEFMTLSATDNCDYSGGNWAMQWIAANPSNPLTILAQTTNCDDCAHSQRLNCVLKGRAVWWLWARIAGWNP